MESLIVLVFTIANLSTGEVSEPEFGAQTFQTHEECVAFVKVITPNIEVNEINRFAFITSDKALVRGGCFNGEEYVKAFQQ